MPRPPASAQRCADLAVQRHQVGGVDCRLVARAAGLRHQVGMMAAQVDAGDGAQPAQPGHRASQAMRGDTHAHAALHHWQQGLVSDDEGRQIGVRHGGIPGTLKTGRL
jgi:hypothetical protein